MSSAIALLHRLGVEAAMAEESAVLVGHHRVGEVAGRCSIERAEVRVRVRQLAGRRSRRAAGGSWPRTAARDRDSVETRVPAGSSASPCRITLALKSTAVGLRRRRGRSGAGSRTIPCTERSTSGPRQRARQALANLSAARRRRRRARTGREGRGATSTPRPRAAGVRRGSCSPCSRRTVPAPGPARRGRRCPPRAAAGVPPSARDHELRATGDAGRRVPSTRATRRRRPDARPSGTRARPAGCRPAPPPRSSAARRDAVHDRVLAGGRLDGDVAQRQGRQLRAPERSRMRTSTGRRSVCDPARAARCASRFARGSSASVVGIDRVRAVQARRARATSRAADARGWKSRTDQGSIATLSDSARNAVSPEAVRTSRPVKSKRRHVVIERAPRGRHSPAPTLDARSPHSRAPRISVGKPRIATSKSAAPPKDEEPGALEPTRHLVPVIRAACGAGLVHGDRDEPRERGRDPPPQPDAQHLRRRILEPRHLVQRCGGRARRSISGSTTRGDIGMKSTSQPMRSSISPATTISTRNEWPCMRKHLWSAGTVRQPVRGLERERLGQLDAHVSAARRRRA